MEKFPFACRCFVDFRYIASVKTNALMTTIELPYRTKAEILAGVEKSFEELKLYQEGKLQFKSLEEVLDELPD